MQILQTDIDYINVLQNLDYPDNTMEGTLTQSQIDTFKNIRSRLNNIARHFKSKYDQHFGIFNLAFNRNPISIHGRMRRVWSGIYKGAANKQYSAQISFVFNKSGYLEVGFYFGNASATRMHDTRQAALEQRLNFLATTFGNALINNSDLLEKYEELFEWGFKAYHIGARVTSTGWRNQILTNPAGCRVIYHLFPENGVITLAAIEQLVSMVIDFMLAIPQQNQGNIPLQTTLTTPLSPEERAKQAKRRTEIGTLGEIYAMDFERKRIAGFPNNTGYPQHIAGISNIHSYDILSIDENGREIYIEVKTTTRTTDDPLSNVFYITQREREFADSNPTQYKLYRVYDIEGIKSCHEISMAAVTFTPSMWTGSIP